MPSIIPKNDTQYKGISFKSLNIKILFYHCYIKELGDILVSKENLYLPLSYGISIVNKINICDNLNIIFKEIHYNDSIVGNYYKLTNFNNNDIIDKIFLLDLINKSNCIYFLLKICDNYNKFNFNNFLIKKIITDNIKLLTDNDIIRIVKRVPEVLNLIDNNLINTIIEKYKETEYFVIIWKELPNEYITNELLLIMLLNYNLNRLENYKITKDNVNYIINYDYEYDKYYIYDRIIGVKNSIESYINFDKSEYWVMILENYKCNYYFGSQYANNIPYYKDFNNYIKLSGFENKVIKYIPILLEFRHIYNSNQPIEHQYKLIRNNNTLRYFRFVKNQNEDVILEMLSNHPKTIFYVRNITENIFKFYYNKYTNYSRKVYNKILRTYNKKRHMNFFDYTNYLYYYKDLI